MMNIWFVLLLLGTVLIFCTPALTDKTKETFEKFYTAHKNYAPKSGVPHHHGTMGISTVAKFSMLSHTPTLFKVKRPGLQNKPNTVSFESTQKPGTYLRYKNYKFHMEQREPTELFAKDATFHERQGPRGRAYELTGRDNWFMCHSDKTPFTLKAKSEKIGTKSFVSNCVYVPVKQSLANKKNIVRTTPSGGALVVNAVPRTVNTDKCINIRFINKLGGPVRVISSMKPEGYLVTANSFKLKTIFKHANHKQRHVIFYADNVQDKDDDVLLNSRNVFTTKPNQCADQFHNVVLTSETNSEQKTEKTNSENTKPITNGPINKPVSPISNPPLPSPPSSPPVSILGDDAPHPLDLNADTPKPPATNEDTPKPPATNEDIPTSLDTNEDTPKPPAISENTQQTPTIDEAANDKPTEVKEKPKPDLAIVNDHPKPITEANEIGLPGTPTESATIPTYQNPAYSTNPAKNKIQSLDDILHRYVGQRSQMVMPGSDARAYEAWSSYGACSVSCGVGFRRRTRVCKPGMYCRGPLAESRACIQGQCASNCVHASDGNVPSGSCCSFPFTFNGVQYDHCILSPKNNERLWCSTTPYYDQDKQWGFCPQYQKAPVRSLTTSTNPPSPMAVSQQLQPQVETQGQQRQQPPRPQPRLPLQQQQSYVAPSSTSYPSYYNAPAYSNPYRAYKENTISCHPMCSKICTRQCPSHCCLAARTDVPLSAYYGNNYGPTDKRNFIFTNPRYLRSLPEEYIEYGEW